VVVVVIGAAVVVVVVVGPAVVVVLVVLVLLVEVVLVLLVLVVVVVNGGVQPLGLVQSKYAKSEQLCPTVAPCVKHGDSGDGSIEQHNSIGANVVVVVVVVHSAYPALTPDSSISTAQEIPFIRSQILK
jgi:hypothetical protein